MNNFTIVILTFNEEVHLPRLLNTIKDLNVPVYIIDSGSTDGTLEIAKEFGATVLYNKFENHPKQWAFALSNITFETEWVIGLDADQEVSPVLFNKLQKFDEINIADHVNGIYFNRHNYFKGKRLKYGGYRHKYLLKMFRAGKGFSDLNENMDHRFIVEGDTIVWKDGIIKEENLKENEISFWLNKHNRYSDLVAQEEIERIKALRTQTLKPKFFGTPDQRIAFLKSIWWRMPLFWRPFMYFFYRFFIQLGFLEHREGRLFHFLQGFWFRLVVDIKIDEILKKEKAGQL